MPRINRKVKVSGFILFVLITGYVGLLISPNILFAHHYRFENFDVYSDQEISNKIDHVLSDVLARISHSELFDYSDRFSIFICNAKWRLALLTRNSNVGGLVNQGLSKNIFIRESEIEKNKIVSPTAGQEIALVNERPLSYFIAHEITHSLQTKIDRFMHLTTPEYIVEGYADYIGKSTSFQYNVYLNDYMQDDFSMNLETGLYNKYHLLIAYLINKKGMSIYQIAKQKIEMKTVENGLKKNMQKNHSCNKNN